MAVKQIHYVGDLETTVDPKDVRAWASCLVAIDSCETSYIGNTISGMMKFLANKNSVVYFHNLKFDGEFILSYLLLNGFKFSNTREPKTFDVLITDDGLFYSITVYFEKKNKQYKKVVFYDSLKKLPFKVEVIAKAFELQDEKLEIDYKAPRALGHELTEQESRYIVSDCRIVAQALKTQFEQGLTRMTNASDALNWYKKSVGPRNFERWFPVLPVALDTDIRRAYKGGFTYLNPKHKNNHVAGGLVFDVNSLYPAMMYYKVLPYGYPMYFEGEYEPDENYPLYICRIRCEFELKKGHIPTIQLKNNRAFVETEYLSSSNGEIVEITLTNVDLKLFLEHYETYNLEYVCGWKFKGTTSLFKEYIDHWMRIKETSTGAIRQLAKLMLNSLYGKFASATTGRKKIPYLDDQEIVRYTYSEPEEREPIYTAMACFITAYARETTIRAAQNLYDRFIYADTDSLHLVGLNMPEDLEIHPTRLGAWAHEATFINSKFIRAKTYMETVIETDQNGITIPRNKVTCAGMPDNVKKLVSYENFKTGSTFNGKLMPKRYRGGIILEETTFTIK